jgi:hypothetical protein
MIALPIVAFSFESVSFKDAIQEGLPSPVSIKRRCCPVPTMYVLVPCRLSNRKSSKRRGEMLPCNVNCDSSQMVVVKNEGNSGGQSYFR